MYPLRVVVKPAGLNPEPCYEVTVLTTTPLCDPLLERLPRNSSIIPLQIDVIPTEHLS